MKPRGVLFLCVANSARSQMAEGIARAVAPPGTPIYSAGSNPSFVNPFAIRVLSEIGLDISGQRSKGLDAVPVHEIGTVVSLCAEEVCPVFPRPVVRHHWPLPDPAVSGSEDEVLENFRRVRDEIRRRIPALFPSA